VSAAEHLREAIAEGCTRDDHDHIADHRAEVRAEVLAETAALADPAKPEVSFFGDYGPQVAWWLRMLIGRREQAAPVPDFFVAGGVYERPRWRFECHAVAPNPDDGQLRAIGFLQRIGGTATVIGLGRDNWADGWTPVETEGP
jgi:hypothetical protein